MSISGIGSTHSASEVYSNYIAHSTTGSTRAVDLNDSSSISAFKNNGEDGTLNIEELNNKKAQAQADLSEMNSQKNDIQSQINNRTEEINNGIQNGEESSAVNADFEEAKADYDEA
ncbi:MAG: hypothetical protein Q4F00_11950, partial [bacterium]|nr:hypothetical protein [bacterium]